MKKYKITYWNKDMSKPSCFIQISKSGKADGVRVCFYVNGKKYWQDNWKNDLLNGIEKDYINSKNYFYRNWKKK